jgi:hypothetical protein
VGYASDVWTKDDIDLATEKAANRITKFIYGEQKEPELVALT